MISLKNNLTVDCPPKISVSHDSSESSSSLSIRLDAVVVVAVVVDDISVIVDQNFDAVEEGSVLLRTCVVEATVVDQVLQVEDKVVGTDLQVLQVEDRVVVTDFQDAVTQVRQ